MVKEPALAKAEELRLAGVSSITAANAWLPGFITAYNRRFGRNPANAKNLHRPLSPADDLDEILASREERTVTRNLTLHCDRMLLLDPTPLTRGFVRKKVEILNYPDGRLAVQFNGTPLGFRVSTRSRRCSRAQSSTTSGSWRCWSRSKHSRPPDRKSVV